VRRLFQLWRESTDNLLQVLCPRYQYRRDKLTFWGSTIDSEVWHSMSSSEICQNGGEWNLACCLGILVYYDIASSVSPDLKAILLFSVWEGHSIRQCAVWVRWIEHLSSLSLYSGVYFIQEDLECFFPSVILPPSGKEHYRAGRGRNGNTEPLSYLLA
jgi:hypothetical protein